MKTYKDLAEASINVQDKDVLRIWEINTPRLYVYAGNDGGFIEFWTNRGLAGLPCAKLFPDNFMLGVGDTVCKVHDGYWVQFTTGKVDDYRPTLDIKETLRRLTAHFVPPKGKPHYIEYPAHLDKLRLCMNIGGRGRRFTVTQDELRDPDELIKSITGML